MKIVQRLFRADTEIENVNHLTMRDDIFGIYKVKNVPLNYCILLGKCFIHLIHSKSPDKQIEFIAFKKFLRNKLHAKENYLCSKLPPIY